MISRHELIALATLLLCTLFAAGSNSDADAELRVERQIEAFHNAGQQPTGLVAEAWAALQSSQANPEDKALNQYKLAWAATRQPEEATAEVVAWLEEGWKDDLALAVSKTCIQIGAYHFHRSDFTNAILAFKRAESSTTSIEVKTMALENVAVSYVQINELEEAIRYFEIAMKLREEKPNALTISNLAGIYNQLNNPEQALSTLALVDWEAESGSTKRMALINKLAALRTLSDREDEVRRTYDSLTEEFPIPIYPQEVAEVVRAALVLNDTAHVIGFLSEIEPLMADNAEFAAEWMPDLAPLFLMDEVPGSERFENLPWATRWQLTRWLVMMRTKDPLTETLKQTSEALEADLSEALNAYEESQDRFWIVVALATAMFGLLLLTWRQRMQVSRLRREVAESGLVLGPEKLHAIEVIRDAITQGKDINSALVHLSNINDLLTPRQPSMSLKDIGDPALEALNSKEMQLLEHIQRGYSAKEISILMNVTAGHIYNMRSVVREKLGLDREMDLEEWLKSHSR